MVMYTKSRQYSLRAFMVFTLVLCVFIALWAQRVRVQNKTVLAIKAANGRVLYDFNETEPGYYDLRKSSRVPVVLRDIFGQDAFHCVVAVDLEGPHANDDVIAQLRHLPGLRRLYIGESAMTNRGLESLRDIPRLQEVYLNSSRINDATMSILKDLHGISELDIQNGAVTDKGLILLKSRVGLKRLHLYGLETTNKGVAELARAIPDCEIIH